MDKFSDQYKFTTLEFQYNGSDYNVVFAPSFYPEDGDLDFTGSFHCIIISSKRGTQAFELMPDAHKRWTTEPKGLDPGVIDILDAAINKSRK